MNNKHNPSSKAILDEYKMITDSLKTFNGNSFFNEIKFRMNQNNNYLEKKCEEHKNFFNTLDKKLKECQAEKDNFENLKNELERKIENYKNANAKLKQDIKECKDKIKNDLEKQIEKYKKENNELKESIKGDNNRIINLQNEANQLEYYKKENEELKGKIDMYKNENKNLENNFKKQVINSQNEINKLKENLKSNEFQNFEIKNKINKKEKEIENYKNENNQLKEKLESYELHNNKIKNNINEQEKEIENSQNEIKKLKEKLESNELEKSEIKNKINEKEKEIENYKNGINKLNEHLKSYELQNNELKNKNDELKKNIEEQKNKFNGVLREFEENSKNKELLIQAKNELKNKENENEMLKKTNEDLINNISTKKEYLEKELQNFYDVVIEIDSINKLKKSGWKINYNDTRKDVYNKIIEEETIKIGVLGLNNVGKSFILSLISGITIPTGWSIETKGISIKYTEGEKTGDNNICLLDSAGFETPLLLEDIEEENKNIEKNKNNVSKNEEKQDEININISIIERLSEISRDKSQTERFIEELIISLSDMLILVVGKLTRREQNLISRIKTIIKDKDNNSKNFGHIIIIHNLAQYCTILEVNNHINQVLKKSATFELIPHKVAGIDKYNNREFYCEPDETDHFFMARQGSEAGNYFNDLTIELIRRKYNECKIRKKLDIPREIIDLFSKMSKDIIEDDIDMNNIEISEDRKVIALKNKKSNNNKDIKNKDKIKCQTIYIDEMGNYNSISSKYIPKYSYYAYKEKNNYILVINIEIPGQIENLTASFFKYAKKKTILIKGSKKRDKLKIQPDPILIKDNRSYDDDFRFYLELDPDIELIREDPYENTDIYKFEFNKKNIQFNKEDDEFEEEEENEEKQNNDNKNDKEMIASGVYIIKFLISQSSWKNINKKYQKKNNKKNEKKKNNNIDDNIIDNNNLENNDAINEGDTNK